MWPFNKDADTLDTQANASACMLLKCSQEAVPTFLHALVAEENTSNNEAMAASLAIELLVFALHLTDRITFIRLGSRKRSAFMNVLLPRVRSDLSPPLDSQLEQIYNTRNRFYGGFQKLLPEKDENLKGTLFWEFGKAMGSVYTNNNPARIALTTRAAADFMNTVNRALVAAKVF